MVQFVVGSRTSARVFVFGSLVGLAAVPSVHAAPLYVSATAPRGGDGSSQHPFNALAAIEQASKPGDTIVVLPSPLSAQPLDGGIALKPNQRLMGSGPAVNGRAPSDTAPRITNSTGARLSGDAVHPANNTEVSNLVILNTFRGGVYGLNVSSVSVHDNNISGSNSSCTTGFLIYGPASDGGLKNPWAAIMVDADSGLSSLTIRDNVIHDAACSDGIATTTIATIDLGGGALDSAGFNCLGAATPNAVQTTGYEVLAKFNWWGQPSGPAPTANSATVGGVTTGASLSASPPACR